MKRVWCCLGCLLLLLAGCIEAEVKGTLTDVDATALLLEDMTQDSEWIVAMNPDAGRIVVRGEETYQLSSGRLEAVDAGPAPDGGGRRLLKVTGGRVAIRDNPAFAVSAGELTGRPGAAGEWVLGSGHLVVALRPEVRLTWRIESGTLRLDPPLPGDLSAGQAVELTVTGGELAMDIARELPALALPADAQAQLTANLMTRQENRGEIERCLGLGLCLESETGYLVGDPAAIAAASRDADDLQYLLESENDARREIYQLTARMFSLTESEIATRFGTRRIAALAPGTRYQSADGALRVK